MLQEITASATADVSQIRQLRRLEVATLPVESYVDVPKTRELLGFQIGETTVTYYAKATAIYVVDLESAVLANGVLTVDKPVPTIVLDTTASRVMDVDREWFAPSADGLSDEASRAAVEKLTIQATTGPAKDLVFTYAQQSIEGTVRQLGSTVKVQFRD